MSRPRFTRTAAHPTAPLIVPGSFAHRPATDDDRDEFAPAPLTDEPWDPDALDDDEPEPEPGDFWDEIDDDED